jgi:hypothetical protein
MANMTDQTRVNAALDVLSKNTGTTYNTGTFTQPAKVRLMGTMGSNTANGTELSMTGYTAGGSTCVFSTESAGQISGPSSGNGAVSWTNSSGSSATIPGLEIWDSTATALRWYQGAWSGGSITLNNGNTLTIAVNGITLNASAW